MHKIDLTGYNKYLKLRLKKGVTNGKKLFSELQKQGFHGKYITLYRYLITEFGNNWKKSSRKNSKFRLAPQSINKTKYRTAIRFETDLGQQAQVDWGHFGEININGNTEKLYCFVLVLGYSRVMYIEFTTRQNLPVFEQCHINAFKALGIPQSIVYDNTKTVVLSNHKLPDGSRRIYFNSAFLDFAKYYDFEIIASPPYWPRNKGKVEAGVKYVRNNFMQGKLSKKQVNSLEQLNYEAQEWIKNEANSRNHSTTHQKPAELWLKEKDSLRFPDNQPDYQTSTFTFRYSTKDQFISYKQCLYSIPKPYAWKKLAIRPIYEHGLNFLKIYFKGQLICQHPLSKEKFKLIKDPTHFIEKTKHISSKKIRRSSWKEYPEIPVRPFSYYDQLTLRGKHG